MQNKFQTSQDGVLKAANLWNTTEAGQRDEAFKNICESQHIDYTQAKVYVMEAIKKNDPRVMSIIRRLQQFGLR